MDYVSIIIGAAKAANVSTHLMLAICAHESHLINVTVPQDGGTPSYGICQLKQGTAESMGYNGTSEALVRPEVNAKWAAKYLAYQLNRYDGDWCQAVSAYNAGSFIESKRHPGKSINNTYLFRVMGMLPKEYYSNFKCMYEGKSMSDKLVLKDEYLRPDFNSTYYAAKIMGPVGKVIAASKSIYHYDNPSNVVLYNANIFTKEDGKIWYGDLDATRDYDKLQNLALSTNKTLYVVHENDGRFDKEMIVNLDQDSVLSVTEKEFKVIPGNKSYYVEGGIPKRLTDEEYDAKYPPAPREKTFYVQEDFEKVEIPDITTIKVRKGISPLSDFQKHLIKMYGREKAQEIYSSLYVTKEYHDELQEKVHEAVKLAHPYLHPVKIEQTVAMEMLNGPLAFMDTPDWADKDSGYTRK